LKVFVVLLGGFLCYGLTRWLINVSDYQINITPLRKEYVAFSGGLTGIGLAYFTTNKLINRVIALISKTQENFHKISSHELIMGGIGAIIGLVIANLINITIIKIPYVGLLLALMSNFLFTYLGVLFLNKKKDLLDDISKINIDKRNSNTFSKKVLDTSAIIDGRIADIYRAGFIEGTLVIPEFVLVELRHIADSHEPEKRVRGRRGLDVLNIIQKELDARAEILEEGPNINKNEEVDVKLIKLAKEINASVITTDYNLNRVAEFQGVKVLNINELAKVIKPIALPGEEMTISIIKDGKEPGQGVGYLEDGTMVVVDDGKKHMGEKLDIKITHVLQTGTGRMIFAKIENQDEDIV
jgi:uncharacterized protein YacL